MCCYAISVQSGFNNFKNIIKSFLKEFVATRCTLVHFALCPRTHLNHGSLIVILGCLVNMNDILHFKQITTFTNPSHKPDLWDIYCEKKCWWGLNMKMCLTLAGHESPSSLLSNGLITFSRWSFETASRPYNHAP